MAGRKRVAVGGLMHETNTFAPTRATYQDFADAADRPPLQRGAEIPETFVDMNIGMVGALEVLGAAGHEVVPLVWAGTTPSGYVTEDAFERIAAMLLDDLGAGLPVDGIYLNLHGAMVAEHVEDAEGELLARLRALVGPDLPIVASLDLHANVTPQMAAHADALVAYRTYPHVDMRETGTRAARLLVEMLESGRPLHKAYSQIPYLIPLTWQCTMIEPAVSIYAEVAAREAGQVASVSFTPGFPAADIWDCGAAVMAYGWTEAAARDAADAIAEMVLAREADFAGRLYDPDAAVREAMRIAATASRPVILADTQDNPGAGGTSDTIGLLAALIRNGAEGAVLAVMDDPAAAAAAHAAGQGAEITIGLGAKSGMKGEAPLEAAFTVTRLGDGDFVGTGPMLGGSRLRLGPMALLTIGGVAVVVASRKMQPIDQAPLSHLGLDPAAQKIIALKSSVHFRAAFQPIAEDVLVVQSPGAMIVDPANLPFRNLRPGIRLHPLGPEFRKS